MPDPTPGDLDMAAELLAYGTPRFDEASVRIAEKLAMLREARARIAELEGADQANDMKIRQQRDLIEELREGITDVDLWETLVADVRDLRAKLAAVREVRERCASGGGFGYADQVVRWLDEALGG